MKTYQLNMTISAGEDISQDEILDKLVEFAEVNDYLIGGGLMEVNEEDESTPDPKLIDSMCMRYRHDFGLLDDFHKKSIRTTMIQLWEEVAGVGFYHKD
jgi:hypothetical protein